MKKKQTTGIPVASSFFLFFLLFNLCFFCLQIALLYSHNNSFISTLKLPIHVYLEQIITLSIHILLYVLVSLIQTFMLYGVLKRSWHYFSAELWQIIIWALCCCAILGANTYFFPLSIFSTLFSPPIPTVYIVVVLCLSLSGIGLLLLNSLWYSNKLLVLIITMAFCYVAMPDYFAPTKNQSTGEQPNIIILGIDSLSPASINKANMPFLSQLLNTSVQFTNTISPLARTYPAWSSILTGLYAKHHHAEENLIAKHLVKSDASIVWTLNQQGYHTIFATDGRSFSTIDKDFGFKQIIGPKLGVNSILLGALNDFPLSNLIVNLPISVWLFPYNYINRASFFSYYPKTFSIKLQKELSFHPASTPTFLAVHFNLPHWPYAWAESLPEQVNNEFSIENREALYQNALHEVDNQLHSFFTYLHKNHYLTNSMLIILSDHGETLYYPNSRLTNYKNYEGTRPSPFAQYLKRKTATVLNKSAGHGSDILSPQQYHSVLAFKIYKGGKLTTTPGTITTRMALIDLAPTLLAFLKQNNHDPMDGISLLPTILNSQYQLPKRAFFIESGICPNQKLSKEQAIKTGQLFYQVNTTNNELELKSSKLTYLREQKLYGIIKDNWILALYPDDKNYITVIQNSATGQWSDNLQSAFSQSSPASALYQELHQFYGKKLFLPLYSHSGAN